MILVITLFSAVLFLLIFLTVCHYVTSLRQYWRIRDVPHREPCPIFGNFGAMFMMKKSYTEMLRLFYDSYRHEKFVGLFQARRPTLMLIDLGLVRSVLCKDFASFSDRISVSTDTKREPLLRNLANMSGDEWKAMRHIVTPTFSSAKLKAMFPLVAESAKSLQSVMMDSESKEIDVPNVMSRYTTDVIGSCAFGFDPGSLKNAESPFLKMSQKMFIANRSTIFKRYCRTYFPRLFKLLNMKSYSSDIEMFFTSIIDEVLKERRNTGAERNDFLQLLLNVQKSETTFKMTDDLITSNSFIFMLAGLETSATTLSFCLYELAKAPDLQEELRKEIVECLDKYGGLTYEAVCAMHTVMRAVLETLRLHPPTPLTTRMCTSPGTLADTGLKLNPKDAILIPLYCIQRDPAHFPDPDKFSPSRFMDNPNPNGFLAFGEGPRCCPGSRFAVLMCCAAIAAVLSRLAAVPGARTAPRLQYDPRSVMLKNKDGIWLTFKRL